MNRFHISLLSLASFSLILFSCGKSTIPGTQDGNWYREVAPFEGPARSHACAFTINENGTGSGTTAYVGTGVDNFNQKYTDFYQAVPGGDSSLIWTQVAGLNTLGAVGRTDAVAFSIGNQGFVGLGQDSAFNPLKDFYQYDSASNTWTRIADFPGNARYLAVGFGLKGYGYVGTGYDSRFYYGDFWKYDPTAQAWSQSTTFQGFKRAGAVSFVYGNRAYVVTGLGESNSNLNDFFVFSPFDTTVNIITGQFHQAANSWLRLNPIQNVNPATFDDGYANIMRSNAVAFVMTGVTTGITGTGGVKAFLTCGTGGTATWEYDLNRDLWTPRTAYESAAVNYAVGFTIQNRSFVTTGLAGGSGVSSTSEFFPNEVYNSLD